MLLRNLAPSQGLCNGTRSIVTKLQQNIIEAKAIDLDNSQPFFYSSPAIYNSVRQQHDI